MCVAKPFEEKSNCSLPDTEEWILQWLYTEIFMYSPVLFFKAPLLCLLETVSAVYPIKWCKRECLHTQFLCPTLRKMLVYWIYPSTPLTVAMAFAGINQTFIHHSPCCCAKIDWFVWLYCYPKQCCYPIHMLWIYFTPYFFYVQQNSSLAF